MGARVKDSEDALLVRSEQQGGDGGLQQGIPGPLLAARTPYSVLPTPFNVLCILLAVVVIEPADVAVFV